MDKSGGTNPPSYGQDAEEFLRLLMDHRRAVYSFILSLVGGWSDADDVMQETVAVMWRKFGEFDRGSNFMAWALQIARYKIFEYQRSRNRGINLDQDVLESLASQAVDISERAQGRLAILEKCLSKLNEKDRNLLRLRYEEDLPIREVSQRTGRPFHGLYKAMSRIHTSLLLCVRRGLRLEGIE